MLVTCQECSTKYDIPDDKVGDDGLNVRCNKCGHKWFQNPDYAVTDDNIDDEFENILAEAMGDDEEMDLDLVDAPEAEDDDVQVEPDDMPMSSKYRKKREVAPADDTKKGLIAASIIGVIVMASGLLSGPSISYKSPTIYTAYSMLGQTSPLAGEDFILENLDRRIEEVAEGQFNVLISGTIINLVSAERALPRLKLQIQDSDGLVLDTHYIELDESMLSGEQMIEFSTVIEDLGYLAKFIQVSFESPFHNEETIQANEA